MKLNLNNVSLRISTGTQRQFPADPIPQVAFSGRSNVGKSSLINSLVGRKALARISSAPGKTTTINFYDVDSRLFLVDLPGYGFAKRAPEDKRRWSILTDSFFTSNKNIDLLRLVVQLIDSRIGCTNDDRQMLSYLRTTETPYIVVATKADKLTTTKQKEFMDTIAQDPDIAGAGCILLYSSEKGIGRMELWYQIFQYTNL